MTKPIIAGALDAGSAGAYSAVIAHQVKALTGDTGGAADVQRQQLRKLDSLEGLMRVIADAGRT